MCSIISNKGKKNTKIKLKNNPLSKTRIIWPYLTVQFSSTKYIHIVMQLSSSSISQIFQFPKMKLCPH